MVKSNREALVKVTGGSSSISGPIINAFTGLVKVLFDAGKSMGSSIRRIVDDEICPLS